MELAQSSKFRIPISQCHECWEYADGRCDPRAGQDCTQEIAEKEFLAIAFTIAKKIADTPGLHILNLSNELNTSVSFLRKFLSWLEQMGIIDEVEGMYFNTPF